MTSSWASSQSPMFGTLHAPPGMAFSLDDGTRGRTRILRLVPKDDSRMYQEQHTLEAPQSDGGTEPPEDAEGSVGGAKKPALEAVYTVKVKAAFRWFCNFVLLGVAASQARAYDDEKSKASLRFNMLLAVLHTFSYTLFWPKPRSPKSAMPSSFDIVYLIGDFLFTAAATWAYWLTFLTHKGSVSLSGAVASLYLPGFCLSILIDLLLLSGEHSTPDELEHAYKIYPRFSWMPENFTASVLQDAGSSSLHTGIVHMENTMTGQLWVLTVLVTALSVALYTCDLDGKQQACFVLNLILHCICVVALYLVPFKLALPRSAKPSCEFLFTSICNCFMSLAAAVSIGSAYYASLSFSLYLISWVTVGQVVLSFYESVMTRDFYFSEYSDSELKEAHAHVDPNAAQYAEGKKDKEANSK